MVSNVEERAEEEKPDEVPVIEDTDDVIIDDALKDQDRPKIDDTPSTMANLDKVEKPVGLQAALSGAKLHDMESLFGSTAGLGNALDFMPETADGDAFGTGAGFAAGLSGMGFGGGGGGGGGFGSGIGGIGGGGGGKAGNTKVAGPRKSTVKQKTKLAMDPPNRVPFVRNPTSARSSRNAPMPFATVTNSSSSPIPICREKSSCSGKSGSMAKSPMRRSNPRR